MPTIRLSLLTLLLLLSTLPCANAQVDLTVALTRPLNPELPALPRASGPRALPPKYSKPDTYSGISGPGQPVVGTGLGGYRTGRDGVMYRGPDPKVGWLPLGDRARGSAVANGLLPPLRPLWDLHLRDTSICLGEDGNYYMTGSTGDNIWDLNDGIELYRSKDLHTWDYLGLVWSVDLQGTWEKQLRYVWAPEIHIINHTFVIAYCMSGGDHGGTGLLISKGGKPEGPYTNPITADRPLTGGIDGTIFQDDDGAIYFTNGAGGTLHRMKPDLSAFDGDPIRVKISIPPYTTGPKRLGHEGASFFKANGKYYLGAADTYQGRYSSICGVADKVEGPYTLVEEAVPCGAGGNYFKDKQGNWWCTYFGNDDQSPWREKPGIVKIDFAPDGHIFIADDQPPFVLQPGAPTHWRKPRETPKLLPSTPK
jgi:xylan 1,4-beta-xylosidase